MARAPKSPNAKSSKQVDALKHDAATRRNIPTAEMESFFRRDEDSAPMPPKHFSRARPLAEGERRTAEEPSVPELIWNGARITITDAQMAELAEKGTLTLSDAQLVWRGKDKQDWSDLVVNVPPLYIQEKIHPKAIIDDLKRHTSAKHDARTDAPDLFADFNGITLEQRAEFYQHDQHWSNRLILGDSLQVMASLSERESLRGKVQCIYFDPPYGIKFNSNWQVSTQSRDVKDGKQADISREPEQVKAFRDTWKDGIHSYLTYLRDRLTVMRDLLTESGSIFVQIGSENPHRVRVLLDEVFGSDNFVEEIVFRKKNMTLCGRYIEGIFDYIMMYTKNINKLKFRTIYEITDIAGDSHWNRYELADGSTGTLTRAQIDGQQSHPDCAKLYQLSAMYPAGIFATGLYTFPFEGKNYTPPPGRSWKSPRIGLDRLTKANRLEPYSDRRTIRYKLYFEDYPVSPLHNVWANTAPATDKQYVVETSRKVIERCLLMATDPGDLVLDPTCGSGTTATVSEQWGRRWITIDTSRVALALARTRLMAARYPWYLLADSREGRAKEAELTKRPAAESPVHNDIRQGFVYERVPHITLKSIANNVAIDDIWEKWQAVLEPLRAELNSALGRSPSPPVGEGGAQRAPGEGAVKNPHPSPTATPSPPGREGNRGWEEWQIPRALPAGVPASAVEPHAKWWKARIARQSEIDASIAARADVEYLYDKPYIDNSRVRVAGPFTVESLSPHRVLPVSEEELIDTIDAAEGKRTPTDADLAGQDFVTIVIDYLKAEGVKQQAKGDRIAFESLTPWPGNFIGACGTFIEGENGPERRAAILIGPEYGTVGR